MASTSFKSIGTSIQQLTDKKYFFLFLFIVAAVGVSIQQIGLNKINNFVIFRTSLSHLLNHINLYGDHPEEYYDKFLYNPSFVILFAPFALLPIKAGIVCWVLFVAIIFYFCLQHLPFGKGKLKFIVLFCFIEFVTSIQGLQSNAINAGLMLLTYSFLEKDKPFIAALFPCLSLFIKVYPSACIVLFLFYPNKVKFIVGCVVWSLVLTALPLLVISPQELITVYQQWFTSLATDSGDENAAVGISLIAILYKWFNNVPPVNPYVVQLLGFLVFLLPLLYTKLYKINAYRILILASAMQFIILFNHAAESPTYIIAVIGACLWFLHSDKTLTNKILMVFVFLFTVLLPTDVYPKYLRVHYFVPYSIKTVPILLTWIKIQVDIYRLRLFLQTHREATPLFRNH